LSEAQKKGGGKGGISCVFLNIQPQETLKGEYFLIRAHEPHDRRQNAALGGRRKEEKGGGLCIFRSTRSRQAKWGGLEPIHPIGMLVGKGKRRNLDDPL